jgi:hypothetical protein
LDLEAVANNGGISEQTLDSRRREARHSFRVETGERSPIALPFLEDCLPAQPCLCSLEGQELEEGNVVVDRYTPL